MDRPRVEAELLRELHRRHGGAHWGRLVLFIAMYLATAGASYALVQRIGPTWLAVVACVPLYLVAAGALHGVSLFAHEAVHGTLSPRRWWNGVLGAICA